MKSDPGFELYKYAAAPLCKKALNGAGSALVGAILGAGAGTASDLITPKDEDEDRKKRLITSILTGAALGSLAGYGASRANTRFVPDAPPPPGWWQRNAPEITWSNGSGAAATVTGGLTARRILASIFPKINEQGLKTRAHGLRLPTVAEMTDQAVQGNQRPVLTAFNNADNSGIANTWDKIKFLFSKDRLKNLESGQWKRDAEFVENLAKEQGITLTSDEIKGLVEPRGKYRLRWMFPNRFNPRRIMQGKLRAGSPKTTLYMFLASLGLVGATAIAKGLENR